MTRHNKSFATSNMVRSNFISCHFERYSGQSGLPPQDRILVSLSQHQLLRARYMAGGDGDLVVSTSHGFEIDIRSELTKHVLQKLRTAAMGTGTQKKLRRKGSCFLSLVLKFSFVVKLGYLIGGVSDLWCFEKVT